MPRKDYGWDRGNVPVIGEHSLAKHRILREYIQKYIAILTKRPGADRFKLTLVDGFAGGGIYQRAGQAAPHLGSPAILIEATAAAQAQVNTTRHKAIIIEPTYFFIDKNPGNIEVLKDTLAKHVYPAHPGLTATLLTGTFEEQLSPILRDIKEKARSPRAIFLLDQYGYNAVPLSSLQLIFRELPKAEVFLTLAVGWITAYLRDAANAHDVVRKSLGIRPEATEDEVEERLLSDGSDAKLRLVQKILHDEFVKGAGAAYATPFFIISRGSHRPYWFLHLANSPRANDVVKELHWEVQNHFSHYGDAGLAMLGFDPYREPGPGQLTFAFDSLAKQRTEQTLLEQLPERIATHYAHGVQFSRLFEALTNETPATKEMVRGVLNRLCREGDLSKQGAAGVVRRAQTAVRDDDVVQLARQTRIRW